MFVGNKFNINIKLGIDFGDGNSHVIFLLHSITKIITVNDTNQEVQLYCHLRKHRVVLNHQDVMSSNWIAGYGIAIMVAVEGSYVFLVFIYMQ